MNKSVHAYAGMEMIDIYTSFKSELLITQYYIIYMKMNIKIIILSGNSTLIWTKDN